MATVHKQLSTRAAPELVWDVVRDVGALHTRLVPGFVVDCQLEGSVRTVTFSGGLTVREPIVTLDEEGRRLVWSSEGGATTHYNASLQVFADAPGSRLVWIADFLPDAVAGRIEAAMSAGIAAMQKALDGLA
jgi:hypothetical protein